MNLLLIVPVFTAIAGVSALFNKDGFFWWPIWVLMVLVILMTNLRGVIMMAYRRDLWRRRSEVTNVDWTAGLLYGVFAFLLGAEHAPMSWWLHAMGLMVWCTGHALSQWALMHNDWAITESKLQLGQKVCRTGPYQWLAHPMYIGTWYVCLGAAEFIGSWLAVIYALVAIGGVLAHRAIKEEHMLRSSLVGYRSYLEGR